MSNLLDRINAAVGGLCPCGAPPAEGSAYCSDDCRPSHISGDTDTREAGHLATPMRWRPDLVTTADDTDLISVDAVRAAETVAIAEGRYNAHIYQRASDPTVWHLRLDDGHRYVGCDLADMGVLEGVVSIEQTARIHDAWQRLERELVNPRHTEPVGGDSWSDELDRRQADLVRALAIPPSFLGFGSHNPDWDISAGTSADFRLDNTAALFDPLPTSLPSMLGVPIVIDDTISTGDATLDRAGETLVLRARDGSFTLTEEVQEQLRDHYAECSRRATAAMAAFDEVFRPVLQQFGEAFTSAFAGISIAAQPSEAAQPDDPMERALQARRNRNTGPTPDRLDGRRRRR